jgi:hypothetical protein
LPRHGGASRGGLRCRSKTMDRDGQLSGRDRSAMASCVRLSSRSTAQSLFKVTLGWP